VAENYLFLPILFFNPAGRKELILSLSLPESNSHGPNHKNYNPKCQGVSGSFTGFSHILHERCDKN